MLRWRYCRHTIDGVMYSFRIASSCCVYASSHTSVFVLRFVRMKLPLTVLSMPHSRTQDAPNMNGANSVRPMYQSLPIRRRFQSRSGFFLNPALLPSLSVWCTQRTTRHTSDQAPLALVVSMRETEGR